MFEEGLLPIGSSRAVGGAAISSGGGYMECRGGVHRSPCSRVECPRSQLDSFVGLSGWTATYGVWSSRGGEEKGASRRLVFSQRPSGMFAHIYRHMALLAGCWAGWLKRSVPLVHSVDFACLLRRGSNKSRSAVWESIRSFGGVWSPARGPEIEGGRASFGFLAFSHPRYRDCRSAPSGQPGGHGVAVRSTGLGWRALPAAPYGPCRLARAHRRPWASQVGCRRRGDAVCRVCVCRACTR